MTDEARGERKCGCEDPGRCVECLRGDVWLLRGAMDSQDHRERLAGEKCGVPYAEHGCDWPDAAAEEVLRLRAMYAAACDRVAAQSDALSQRAEKVTP